MNTDKINELVNKIPITLLLVAYLGYLGFDFYSFQNDAQSPLVVKTTEIEAIKSNNKKLDTKLKQLNEFVRTLDRKRAEIRGMAQELQSLKGSLPESFDIPKFIKMIFIESKMSGISLESLNPLGESKSEYYSEYAFSTNFRGIFFQLLKFLERISSTSQIIRIEKFSIKPTGASDSKLVEVEGEIELKAYRYLGSKADTVGTSSSQNTNLGSVKSKVNPGSEMNSTGTPGGGK